MLKACWDYIVGAGQNNETTYRPTLNGNNSYIAQWTSQNLKNMFRLPKSMNVSDQIHIQGTLTGNESMFFNLHSDNQNAAYKIEINFLEQSIYEHNEDGNKQLVPDMSPSDLFTGPAFTLSVVVNENDGEYMLDISIGEAYVCSLSYNDISRISVLSFSNNVSLSQLNFRYA